MATIRNSGTILSNIASDLADNNAGLISAADVRNNIADTVASIGFIVASGDTDVVNPFFNDVRAKKTGSHGGTFVAESGLVFPNAPYDSSVRQIVPYPGAGNIDHNSLANLTDGDPHTQYLPINGSRAMEGNLAASSYWIGPSGNDSEGFKFVKEATRTTILTSGTFKFSDNSTLSTGKAAAKAWIYFDASGVGNVPVVNSSYNINKVERLGQGKIRLTFNSGVFKDNNYVAIAQSNARTTESSAEDFDRNTVGLVNRQGNDGTALRSITYYILNEQGNYVDGQQNSFVAYGLEPNETAGTAATIVGL
jgi:hypothetical protein